MNMGRTDEQEVLNDIAVIGMSGRFPGAANIEMFWDNLRQGRECIRNLSDEELLRSGIDRSAFAAKNYVKAAADLEGIEFFDNSFFGFTPQDAKLMDPQVRVLLECAWAAVEDAGYNVEDYAGAIGMFAGAAPNTYFLENLLSNHALMSSLAGPLSSLAVFTASDAVSTMVSFKMNLRGPSITVQTACSTSLVAVHLACQSLLSYESDMALAGGVNLTIPQERGYQYEPGLILSPDGHCRPFDANAAGTIFGGGVGLVLLKRLSDALSDGDHIHAVIKGSAVNNDGSTKAGFTAPSVVGQSKAIADALAVADVPADSISYVEAHGTGTILGDPIEIEAISKAFSRTTTRHRYCGIGSVKSNIGHLDRAAGVASLIKTILSLENRQIPPTLHFERPNPSIPFDKTPFYVVDKLTDWNSNGTPRRAGVNSVGFGGTNCYMVLEEAPERAPSSSSCPNQLLLLSARTEAALDRATHNLAEHLEKNPEINLADTAFTLQTGRQPFDFRRAVVCRDVEDAASILKSNDKKRIFSARRATNLPSIVFMFPGQGAQYVGMGRAIYEHESVFRSEVDRCFEILKPELDLREVLFPREDRQAWAAEQLVQTRVTQPALFLIEYALARLWQSWGIQPAAMIGHSIGEYVAACIAGVFSLEDGLRLVAHRARLVQSQPSGAMLAIRLPEEGILPLLDGELSLAALNAPSLSVASGPASAVAVLEEKLASQRVPFSRLATSHAFHSAMMEPVVAPLTELLKSVPLAGPQIPFVSNVTGKWITTTEATDPAYWADHLRAPVRFSDGVVELLSDSPRMFLEVGPGHALGQMVRQHIAKSPQHAALSSFGYSKGNISESVEMMTTLGRLWIAGSHVDWPSFHSGQKLNRVPLPTYPFERRRYWVESAKPATKVLSIRESEPKHPTAESTSPAGLDKVAHGDSSVGGFERPELNNAYIPPKSPSEKKLAAIWQRMMDIEKIGREDNYFDLGGDSLLAVRVFAEVEKQFGIKLPLSTLLDAPVLWQQAMLLQGATLQSEWPSLVTIQAGGSKPPLFLVHGAEGNILLYRQLVHYLGPDQPVFGFQSQGLNGDGPVHTTIEEMASYYVNELKPKQPHGPYYLGGYCMGGTVALEMAQQLRAQGEEVGLVSIFDAYNFSLIPEQQLHRLESLHLLQNLWFHACNLNSVPLEDRSKFLREKWSVSKGRLGIRCRASWDEFRRLFNPGRPRQYPHLLITQTNDQAMLQYIPKPYSGRVAVFRPKGNFWKLEDPTLGWSGVIQEGLEVREIPAMPKGMLVEPFVRILAEELKDCLCDAQNSEFHSDRPGWSQELNLKVG
jgi:acyl transferase domain-containing protein/thioesterase domain-containing protein/acyl carrier protein